MECDFAVIKVFKLLVDVAPEMSFSSPCQVTKLCKVLTFLKVFNFEDVHVLLNLDEVVECFIEFTHEFPSCL